MFKCIVEIVWDNGINGEDYENIGNCEFDTVESVKDLLDQTYGVCHVEKLNDGCYQFKNKSGSRKSTVYLSGYF